MQEIKSYKKERRSVMTGAMIGFIAGLFIGGFFGVSTIALMIVAKEDDEKMNDFFDC